jgi:hypothetical protein
MAMAGQGMRFLSNLTFLSELRKPSLFVSKHFSTNFHGTQIATK